MPTHRPHLGHGGRSTRIALRIRATRHFVPLSICPSTKRSPSPLQRRNNDRQNLRLDFSPNAAGASSGEGSPLLHRPFEVDGQPALGRTSASGCYRQSSVSRFREMLLSYNFICRNSNTAGLTQQPTAVLRALDSGREGGGGAYGRRGAAGDLLRKIAALAQSCRPFPCALRCS
jgi:hypothetical protein